MKTNIVNSIRNKLEKKLEMLEKLKINMALTKRLKDHELRIYNIQSSKDTDVEDFRKIDKHEPYKFKTRATSRGFSINQLEDNSAYQEIAGIYAKLDKLRKRNIEINDGKIAGGFYGYFEFERYEGKYIGRKLDEIEYGEGVHYVDNGPIYKELDALVRDIFYRRMNENTYNRIVQGIQKKVSFYDSMLDGIKKEIDACEIKKIAEKLSVKKERDNLLSKSPYKKVRKRSIKEAVTETQRIENLKRTLSNIERLGKPMEKPKFPDKEKESFHILGYKDHRDRKRTYIEGLGRYTRNSYSYRMAQAREMGLFAQMEW